VLTPQPSLPGSVASVVADFNGDGKADLAIAQAGSDSVGILLGNGDGTFQPQVNYSLPDCEPGFLTAGNFQNGGHLDLLGTCTAARTIFVLPGNGDGTFGPLIPSAVPETVLSGVEFLLRAPFAVADFNGDGNLDLALVLINGTRVTFNSTELAIFNGNGDGTFSEGETLDIFGTNIIPAEALTADLNNDGKPDLAGISLLTAPTTNGNLNVQALYLWSALNDGKGNFTPATQVDVSSYAPFSISTADVNGDGQPDIILAGLLANLNDNNLTNESTSLAIELGNGDGTFQLGYSDTDPSPTVMIQAFPVDLRNTGLPDLVTTMGTLGSSKKLETVGVGIRLNNGDGTFAPIQTVLSGTDAPLSLSVGDFNGDGRMDVEVNELSVLDPVTGTKGDTLAQVFKQLPAGLTQILLNGLTPAPFVCTNAASYSAGPVATDSIVVAFGTTLATSTAPATSLPLPTTLGGATVTVTDSAGTARPAPLFHSSPLQINYAVPDGTATGTASVAITAGGLTQTIQKPIVSVAPGLFGGDGTVLGQVLTYTGSTLTNASNSFSVTNGAITPAPINVSTPGTAVYLVLYGTGIRNYQNAVTATIGGTTVPTQYSGAQGVYVGLDQVNILLPSSLQGAGTVSLTLSVDGQVTNALNIAIQ
jgi:uncharacterized protein (TIGR03437 family)